MAYKYLAKKVYMEDQSLRTLLYNSLAVPTQLKFVLLHAAFNIKFYSLSELIRIIFILCGMGALSATFDLY